MLRLGHSWFHLRGHLRIEHSDAVVVHFSPSSTSRPGLCLSTVRVGACRVVSGHPAVPRSPGRLHDGTLTVSGSNQSILTIVYASIPLQARSVRNRMYGPRAVLWQGQMLAVRCPQTGQTQISGRRRLCSGYSRTHLEHGPRSLT